MGTKKQEEQTRYMELSIPQEIISDIAEIIEENDMDANILGKGEEEEDTVKVGFDYVPEQRESIMEILELIEDFNNPEEEEDEEEEN